MKSKLLCLVLAVHAGLALGYAAEAPKTSDALNTSYVEGVRLIADTNAALERANRVLSIVEQGADGQAGRISEMEVRLQNINESANRLETDSIRRSVEGARLTTERERLESRFAALEIALQDDRTLLSGATKVITSLLDAADKSGKLAERRLADQMASQLKSGAEQVRLASDRLAQTKLRVTLETTLLQGLQPRGASDANDIKALKAELAKLMAQVASQRSAANKLIGFLNDDRSRLAQRQGLLAQSVEHFRLVQVAVLRHWLLDGPPAEGIPSLTINDVIEAGIMSDEDSGYSRINSVAASRINTPSVGGVAADKANMDSFAVGNAVELDPAQASAEFVQLSKQARWYLAMLSRLTAFATQSLEDASIWAAKAENWRNQLSSSGRTLAEQRGALTSLTMEQGIVATTVELMTKQAATAREQVDGVVTQVEKQTKRLEEISADLKKQAEKI